MSRRDCMPVGRCVAVLALAAGLGTAALGEERLESEDQDLLEFLGSFDATDEDWLAVSIEQMVRENEETTGAGEDRVEAAKDED